MATKIRLQRHGKKGQPFYHIVIADSRAPRDGRFIENIGYYDPIKVPARIHLDLQKALDWYRTGAQPTDTVRNILRHEGVLFRHHLQIGVAKNALTQEQADVKFNDWKQSKESQAASKRTEMQLQERTEHKKQLEAEKKTNENRLAKIQEKNLSVLKEREEAARQAYAEQQAAKEQPIKEAGEQIVKVVEEQTVEVVKYPEFVAEEHTLEAAATETSETIAKASEAEGIRKICFDAKNPE